MYQPCNQRWTEINGTVNDTTSTVNTLGFHTRLLLPEFSRATMHLLPGARERIVFLLNMHAHEPSLIWCFKSAY